jgi:hypothetical protein
MSIWDVIQNVRMGHPKTGHTGRAWATDAVATQGMRSDVEQRIERLELMIEAMWELMSERERLTVTDLAHRVRAIDARTGGTDPGGWDGVRMPEFRCTSCQAVIPAGQMKCQFCGTEKIEARTGSFSA